MTNKRVLDACCGSKMMWFDKSNPDTVFGDQRNESHTLCDGRALNIHPDIVMDFCAIPFANNTFNLVVFDPPHLKYAGEKSWLRAKYGVLKTNWQDELKQGFAECFRVLDDNGVLIFKWAEDQIKIKDVIGLSPVPPLFGHPTGRKGLTHWMTFIKPKPITP